MNRGRLLVVLGSALIVTGVLLPWTVVASGYYVSGGGNLGDNYITIAGYNTWGRYGLFCGLIILAIAMLGRGRLEKLYSALVLILAVCAAATVALHLSDLMGGEAAVGAGVVVASAGIVAAMAGVFVRLPSLFDDMQRGRKFVTLGCAYILAGAVIAWIQAAALYPSQTPVPFLKVADLALLVIIGLALGLIALRNVGKPGRLYSPGAMILASFAGAIALLRFAGLVRRLFITQYLTFAGIFLLNTEIYIIAAGAILAFAGGLARGRREAEQAAP